MPRPKALTTRRSRFLWDRERYLFLERLHKLYNWKFRPHPVTGEPQRFARKWDHVRGSKQIQPLATSITYDATPSHPPHVVPLWQKLGGTGYGDPPRVKLTFPLAVPIWEWEHQRTAVIGFHARRVKTRRKRPRDARYTAFNLQVSGCNYFYFRNQCYRDTDVLGRHPTETECANGAPLGPPGWPVPLGYQ